MKTRLCPPLTPTQAARVSQYCLDYLVNTLSADARLTLGIAFEPLASRAAFAARYPRAVLLPQHGGDLTAKLRHLLANRDTPCLITGSDCPNVPPAYYTRAALALEQGAAVVLGPTRDGGSYLLGLEPAYAGWFDHIPWSTAEVSAALRRRASEYGWPLHELPPWYDIDTPADLARLCADLPHASDLADILLAEG